MSNHAHLKITAVIVNYNSGHWLARCLTALQKNAVDRVIVIDNGSSDNSLEYLQLAGNESIDLLRNPDNPGYATACNQGLAETTSEFILFLNPDCELLDKALESLSAALMEHPQAVLAGPWVINKAGQVQRATLRRLPTFSSSMIEFLRPGSNKGVELSQQARPEGVQLAEAVSGACMLARTATLRKLQGFDPVYRLHCEDLDLMQRAAQSGYEVLLVPEALVIHQQGVSSRARPFWVEWQKHRGMWRYYKKFEASEDHLLKQFFVGTSIIGHYLFKAPILLYQKYFNQSEVLS